VDSKSAFLSELEHDPPDVILSDHGCLHSTASRRWPSRRTSVLTRLSFSSPIAREEVAIETFESGATDYVLKNNLSKLAPAVRARSRFASAGAAQGTGAAIA